MKAMTLFIFTAFLSASAFGATYEVPVLAGLEAFAKFDLTNFSKNIIEDKVVVEYDLPQLLTGSLEHIKLEGKIISGDSEIIMYGDKALAICSAIMYEKSDCKVEYYNLELDEPKALAHIQNISQNPLEFKMRLEVMRAFSTDPVGIVKY